MLDTPTSTIVLRAATADDDDDLHRLSQLDSAATLLRPAIVAEVDGVPLAALSLEHDRVVADPFKPTADAVALLRARSAALRGALKPRRRAAGFAARLLHA